MGRNDYEATAETLAECIEACGAAESDAQDSDTAELIAQAIEKLEAAKAQAEARA